MSCCHAGPDLGDFIRGSDLAGYSVPAPPPKVKHRLAGRALAKENMSVGVAGWLGLFGWAA